MVQTLISAVNFGIESTMDKGCRIDRRLVSLAFWFFASLVALAGYGESLTTAAQTDVPQERGPTYLPKFLPPKLLQAKYPIQI